MVLMLGIRGEWWCYFGQNRTAITAVSLGAMESRDQAGKVDMCSCVGSSG